MKKSVKQFTLSHKRTSFPHTDSPTHQVTQLVGQSNAMRQVRELIRKIGTTDETVLLGGETGTGKDLTAQLIHQASVRLVSSDAQLIHQASVRRDQPFVSINCAALPSTLIENELFGHTKGAFTGASEARKGAVQQAEGGTLFLDEIGELPLEFQAKLLRVIDMKAVSPLGGTETLVDVRIIAASNRDLRTAVRDGVFRPDLFHRLNIMPVYLPPLRERRADISTLVDYFLEKFISDFQQSVGLETDVYPLLESYSWPGNVRELESLLKRVFLLTEKPMLNATDFAPHLDDATKMSEASLLPLEAAMACYERQHLCQVLERTAGNKKEAAHLLDLPRSTLYRKLAKYEL